MGGRKRWSRCVQWVLIVVVVVEVGFLLRLDGRNGVSFTSSFASRLYPTEIDSRFPGDEVGRDGGLLSVVEEKEEEASSGDRDEDPIALGVLDSASPRRNCRAWLEEADRIPGGRNFSIDPVRVAYGEAQVWSSCGVGCIFEGSPSKPDGVFRKLSAWTEERTSHVLRSMESATYYPENAVETAHKNGFDVAMTTSLASDVPVGYFSWAEYDIMGPVSLKTEGSLAAAFISNCAAHNFRLEALEELKKNKVSIDSYGNCLRNREGRGVNKLETLKRYKFSLAFENSNEEDYVTEKFWQSLVAGSVPVVVGAPNIMQFAPAPNSLLYIQSQQDVGRVAQEIRYLGSNATAYNETLRWKYEGPSDAFKALVDMAAVHSSCRLCIHLATRIQLDEEKQQADKIARRPCRCTDELGIVTYHLYVRERGRYYPESVFLRSTDLTVAGLQAAILARFRALKHVPIWWQERPLMIRGDGSFSIYKLYPVGLTQRDALYSVYFHTDDDVKGYLDESPCPKLEVIFV